MNRKAESIMLESRRRKGQEAVESCVGLDLTLAEIDSSGNLTEVPIENVSYVVCYPTNNTHAAGLLCSWTSLHHLCSLSLPLS